MKRLILLFFVMLLVGWWINSSYEFFAYQFERAQCYDRFELNKKKISPDFIITLSFDDDQPLHWEKKNKEFVWLDKLYDVISIVHEEGKVVIRCVEDTAETTVVQTYRLHFNRRQENEDHPFVFGFCQSKYILPRENPLIDILLRTVSIDQLTLFPDTQLLPPLGPPPDKELI